MSWSRSAPFAAALALSLASSSAKSHWCHDIFASSYNIVVRPAADTVSVPSSGSATLDVFVQNNLGYPLQNFTLGASSTGYTINVTRQAPKVTGYLMPGESLRHTLSISRSGGASLSVESINFYVSMGPSTSQSQCYGTSSNTCGIAKTKSAVIKKTNGDTFPVGPLSVDRYTNAWDQAEHLRHAAQADFGDINQGLDNLLTTFCAGRLTWRYQAVVNACCPDTSTTICPPATCNSSRAWSTVDANNGTGSDGPHLWAAGELAIRKSALGPRAATLRDRLRCAYGDPWPLIRAYVAFVLGYLGEDAGARSFLEGIISSSSSSADDKLVAKASLLLMKNATDLATYRADVTTGASSSNAVVALTCAAALGIADSNDTLVQQVLIPRARWSYPFDGNDTVPVFAAELLNLVAWDRRGWAVNGGDTGRVCFYETCGAPDTTNPRPPAGVTCTASPGGTIRVAWNQVTQDVNGNPEAVTGYRVYSGNAARPSGCSRPASCGGFDYNNVATTSAIYRDFPSLNGTQTYYFTVTAVDGAGNASDYATEVSCRPQYAPVAQLNCTPLSGTAPLSVSCDGNGSTDQNGASDIVTYAFRLDAQAWQTQNPVTYDLQTPGSRQVQLQVTDSTGLTGSASATINVTSSSGNQPPVAQASGTPVSGPAPLTVNFSSSGSSDPDTGQTLSYSWAFDDGSAPSTQANPSHTFTNSGTYSVVLTVTDDGTPPLSSTALVEITATGNRPPNVQPATVTPQTGQAPLLVQFDATGVTDPDGHQVTVTWDFGDGSATSTSRSGSHTFAQTGTYTVTLSAQDDGLPAIAPAEKQFTVTVSDQPPANRPPDCANATVTPTSGAAPLTVTLDASGCTDPDGDGLTYLWRVPTSMISEETFTTSIASYQFTEARTVTIDLIVSDDAAERLETTRSFEVVVADAPLEPAVGSCACASSSMAWGALAVLAAAILRRSRRRS